MANVGDLVVKLKADAKELESGLSAAQRKLTETGDKMKGIGKKMSMGITAPIAGIGIGAIMTGANFEKGMNRVKALTGTTGDDFAALTQQAKDLGSSTAFSATQASEAMGFLAMAGFKSNDIIGAMPGVLNLAAAAQMDLGDAADITSNILTGFGKDVSELGQVNDVLVKAMTSANVDLTMLGESMKYVGPVASSAGMDFEETAAAIALLGNAGIQGSMAGTSLRGAMTRLLKPSGDAAATMAKLGLNVLDSEGNLRSFTEITKQLEDANISTADAMTIFGQRAGPAMMALVSQGSGALDEMTQSLKDSGGTAESIASVQMEGMSGAITEMKSAFEGLMIAISEDILPVLTKLIDAVVPILQKFTAMPGPIKAIVVVVGILAAVIGPLLIVIGMMIPAIAALSGVMAGLSLSMGPITLAIVGIAAAIAVGILIWKNWDKIVALFSGTIEAVKQTFANVSQAILDVFDSKWGWLLPGGVLFKALKLILTNWEDIWAAIRILAIVAWEKISGAFTEHFGWALPGGAIHKALIQIKETWDKVWSGVRTKFDNIAFFVRKIWTDYFGWLRPGGAIFKALDAFQDKWSSVWNAIKGMVKGPVNLIVSGVNKLLDVFNGMEIGWEAKKVRGVTVLPGFQFSPFNLAHIPKMAQGGIVNKPTLAMLGEAGPEAVTPLRKGMSSGATIVINMTGPTYGFDDFEKKVSMAIRDGVRRGGFQGILSPAR